MLIFLKMSYIWFPTFAQRIKLVITVTVIKKVFPMHWVLYVSKMQSPFTKLKSARRINSISYEFILLSIFVQCVYITYIQIFV